MTLHDDGDIVADCVVRVQDLSHMMAYKMKGHSYGVWKPASNHRVRTELAEVQRSGGMIEQAVLLADDRTI